MCTRLSNERAVGYSSEVDTRYWYGNLPVEYLVLPNFYCLTKTVVINLKAILDFLVIHETLIEMLSLLVFGASLFYYVLITLVFEFICFAQNYNARYGKLDTELNTTNTLESISMQTRRYLTLVVAYCLL